RLLCFCFSHAAPSAIYTLSLHDALPILAGMVYMSVVIRRARGQSRYVPVLEDWLWHCAFPLVAYVTLLVAALVLWRDPPRSLLVIGAMALFLLFIGIHNAWDAVTYIATQQPQHEEGARDRTQRRSP